MRLLKIPHVAPQNSFKELQKRSTQMKDKMSTLTTAVGVEKKRNHVQEEQVRWSSQVAVFLLSFRMLHSRILSFGFSLHWQIAQAEKMVKDFKRVVKSNKEELAKVWVVHQWDAAFPICLWANDPSMNVLTFRPHRTGSGPYGWS